MAPKKKTSNLVGGGHSLSSSFTGSSQRLSSGVDKAVVTKKAKKDDGDEDYTPDREGRKQESDGDECDDNVGPPATEDETIEWAATNETQDRRLAIRSARQAFLAKLSGNKAKGHKIQSFNSGVTDPNIAAGSDKLRTEFPVFWRPS